MINAAATRWVEDLRSGKYRQIRHYLRTDAGYCCLGIACEIYMEDHDDLVRRGSRYYQVTESGQNVIDGDDVVLPNIVQTWLGLRTNVGKWDNAQMPITANSLAGMNDRGVPFKHIADRIEEEPEGLFV